MNDFLYWLISTGAPILAAIIMGIFGLVIIRIYKTIAPKLQESKLNRDLEESETNRQILQLDVERLAAQLQESEAETAELRDTVRNLADDVEDAEDRVRQIRRSEEAYADNLELLKSSIEDTILAAQPDGGYASAEVQSAARALAEKLLRETERAVYDKLSSQNYPTSKKRLEAAFEFAARQGVAFSEERRALAMEEMKIKFEQEVKREFERQEQSRIRAQMREEARLEAERARELKRLTAQEDAIKAALQSEMARSKDEHSQEMESLRAQLAEAQARTERAVSQAQLTRAGNIYVISNIGSFGEGIFKVGMTRRLEPLDRIRELGDASVPFPFDVHMMISCIDAPTLENTLHRELNKQRINRVNPRKEFFKVELARIVQIVEEQHGHVEYLADPEAEQYRNSVIMTDEEEAYVDSVLEPLTEAEIE